MVEPSRKLSSDKLFSIFFESTDVVFVVVGLFLVNDTDVERIPLKESVQWSGQGWEN